jgi:hypothetical protein
MRQESSKHLPVLRRSRACAERERKHINIICLLHSSMLTLLLAYLTYTNIENKDRLATGFMLG